MNVVVAVVVAVVVVAVVVVAVDVVGVLWVWTCGCVVGVDVVDVVEDVVVLWM